MPKLNLIARAVVVAAISAPIDAYPDPKRSANPRHPQELTARADKQRASLLRTLTRGRLQISHGSHRMQHLDSKSER